MTTSASSGESPSGESHHSLEIAACAVAVALVVAGGILIFRGMIIIPVRIVPYPPFVEVSWKLEPSVAMERAWAFAVFTRYESLELDLPADASLALLPARDMIGDPRTTATDVPGFVTGICEIPRKASWLTQPWWTVPFSR